MELVNEWGIQLVSTSLVIFTDFVPDPSVRYRMGFSVIVTIGIIICFNMAFVFRYGGRRVGLWLYKNVYKRYKNKKKPK